MISEQIMSAIQWIFSGIGRVVLTLAIGFFYKKRKFGENAKNPPQTSVFQKFFFRKVKESRIVQTQTIKAENLPQASYSQELSGRKVKQSPITQTQTIKN
ncbi:MAG: hypothetical protein LBK94_09610 [Prevotellaceae bacterium]|jgi:hypothetical protein|nr:hypothetical protein [Prevotellaceae bacterium]